MTGKVPADPHMALAAHLNALMGTFFLLGVAWTLPMLRYGAVGQQRLAWLVIVANFANWSVTCVKAWLHVSGVDFIGQAANDAIFITLTVTVVLPALAPRARGCTASAAPREPHVCLAREPERPEYRIGQGRWSRQPTV